MLKIRCLLIEDEKPSRDELRFLLEPYECIEIIGEADNGSKAYELIKTLKPDLLFMDVSMPGMSGVEVASKLMFLNKTPQIVFTTAHREYAVKAFELGAVDYLLKPYDEKRIQMMIVRIMKWFEQEAYKASQPQVSLKKMERLAVSSGERSVLLGVDEISYCCSENERIVVHSELGVFEIGMTLQELVDKTPLFRIHRSCVVNINFIHEVYPWFNGTYQIVLKDIEKTTLTVSRSYVKDLKQKIML